MRKCKLTLVTLLLASLNLFQANAQSVTVSGNVKNSATNENLSSVSVIQKGTTIGTYTDPSGNFTLNVRTIPVTLVISSVGFEHQDITVTSTTPISVSLVPGNELGQEVVVSATRVAGRILESPVSIERVSAATIRSSPAASYYDIVSNLKGVDVVTASLTFKTPTTRGFNVSGNTRFNQLIDGMDNQAPGLNFSVGSVIGTPQLDVDNMELLPGASSALYGPGGMNGTLLITSKNPFRYQGLSFEAKVGALHVDEKNAPLAPYHNWSLRWADKVSEKFAYKIVTELIQAKDWVGADLRNYSRLGTNGEIKPGTRITDPDYDGVNVYGDETRLDIRQVFAGVAAQAPFLADFANSLMGKPMFVSRTGYEESEIIDPTTLNYKVGGSLNYKLTTNTEAILQGLWGTGNTVYTGSERYSLKNLRMGNYKFELANPKWFMRAWTTQEDAGESFNATVTTRYATEAVSPSTAWYPIYGQAFLLSKMSGMTDFDAHQAARATADANRPDANSAAWKNAFNQVRSVPISKGGGLFLDRSNLYQLDAQYNLSDITNAFADILVGGNIKRYVLNSEGTLFADSASKINIDEYGAYIQATRGFADDALKLSFSGRYDKNENFKGRFTPRAAAVVRVAPNSNLRFSYQTAYRFPSTQQQWIDLTIGSNTQLIGGDPSFWDYYNFRGQQVHYVNDYIAGSLRPYTFEPYRPESNTTFEAGYKGLVAGEKVLIDLYGYYGEYKDFLTRTLLVQSNSGALALGKNIADPSLRIYSVPTNIEERVKTYGFGAGFDYRLGKNYALAVNVSSDRLSELPEGMVSFFNSPKWRVNTSLGNTGFGRNQLYGFNVTYRYQDGFYYNGDFANGQLNEVHIVDALLSVKIPKLKSMVKLGANNLLNQYYYNAVGNAQVGGLYYLGFGYNIY